MKPGDNFSTTKNSEETVNLFVGTEFEFSELDDEEKITCLAANPDINIVLFDSFNVVRESPCDDSQPSQEEETHTIFSPNF